MSAIFMMLLLSALFVIVVPRLLGVPLSREAPTRPRPIRTDKTVSRASTRLIVALLMLATGTALLVFLTVRWILRWLETILS